MSGSIFFFDMSGVLIDTDLDMIKSRVSAAVNLPLKEINNSWRNDMYDESELGFISSEEYFEFYSGTIGLPWSYDIWINEWSNVYSYNKNGFGLFNYLIQCDFDVYILSNLAEYHKIAIERKLDGFWKLSKANFLSYEMNLLKPDPAIYECVCSQTNTLPANCFYFDDVPENVNAAAKVGMNSFHFLNDPVEDMLQWVRNRGVGFDE